MFYKVMLRPVYLKHKVVFCVEVFKVLSDNSLFFVSSIGYYDMNRKRKKIVIDIERLGFWLNKGAIVNFSV
jgi:ribosomal protein S16